MAKAIIKWRNSSISLDQKQAWALSTEPVKYLVGCGFSSHRWWTRPTALGWTGHSRSEKWLIAKSEHRHQWSLKPTIWCRCSLLRLKHTPRPAKYKCAGLYKNLALSKQFACFYEQVSPCWLMPDILVQTWNKISAGKTQRGEGWNIHCFCGTIQD